MTLHKMIKSICTSLEELKEQFKLFLKWGFVEMLWTVYLLPVVNEIDFIFG